MISAGQRFVLQYPMRIVGTVPTVFVVEVLPMSVAQSDLGVSRVASSNVSCRLGILLDQSIASDCERRTHLYLGGKFSGCRVRP